MYNRKYLSMMLTSICIAIGPVLFAEDAFEPNDSFGTALPLSLGTHANLEAINEDDWFRLAGLNLGQLHIEMSHILPGDLNNGTNDINVVLFNSSNQAIAANNGNNVTEKIDYHVIVPGDYYIRVFPTNSGTNTYSLTANRVVATTGDDSNDNNEGNDSFDTPTVIADYNQPVTGQVAKDEDWFTIAAPAGTFTVTVTYDGGTNLQLEGYGSAGNRLINSTIV